MSFREMVEGIISFEGEERRFKGWLAVLEDVETLSPEDYERLRRASKPSYAIMLEPAGLTFDRRMAAFFFAATKQWREVSDVTLEELIRTMPPGVVSGKARRVAVWGPIERALSNVTAEVTAVGNCLLADVEGSADRYITCIDLGKSMFACTCPAYKGGVDRRHILCKHLIHSIYRHSEEIMRFSAVGSEWLKSLKAAQRHKYAYIMVCNWIYYFIKHVFAGLEMRSARLINPEDVRKTFFK